MDEIKQCVAEGKYDLAKEALLNILNTNEANLGTSNVKVFGKLGDVCSALKQNNDAQMYYKQSINQYIKNNEQNDIKTKPTPYRKYAHFLQYELQQYNEAKTMYLKYIEVDKHNTAVYFHFAQLLRLMKQFEEARKCYIHCLSLDASKACVHYHFAKLLYEHFDDQTTAMHHMKQCIKIKPNIAKYHLQHALMLKDNRSIVDVNQISKSFEEALRLSHYQDTFILIKYAQYLIYDAGEKEKGEKYMQLASKFSDDTKETKAIVPQDTDDNNNTQFDDVMLNRSNDKDNYRHLKYIVYEFDGSITYWNLYDSVQGQISHLYTIQEKEFLQIFAWRDRIRRLAKHFESVISVGSKIIFLITNEHNGYIDIVKEALQKAYLKQFVHEFVCVDDKTKYIKHLKMKYNLKYEELLYIDSDRNSIGRIREHCFSIFIFEPHGLTLYDIENIEGNIGISTTTRRFSLSNCNKSYDWIRKNRGIYNEIRNQIKNQPSYHDPVDDLDIIQWIHTNWSDKPYKESCLEFAEMYRAVCAASSDHDMWTAHEILNVLLEIQPQDSDFNMRQAMCVINMGNTEDAEQFHLKSVQGRYLAAFKNYGYFLILDQRLDEAVQIFKFALRVNPINIKCIVGMGRTLRRMSKFEDAEYYFRKAIAIDPKFWQAHFRLGNLLPLLHRYEEAIEELTIAIQLNPGSYLNHYVMALTCLEINNIERAKCHLQQTLNINPDFRHAKDRYYKLFDHYYVPIQMEENSKKYMWRGYERTRNTYAPIKGQQKEFDIFWIHKLEGWLTDDIFSVYRDLFIEHNLNNIDSLFSIYMKQLREIGITNEEHLEAIMECVDREIIGANHEFKDWLGAIVGNKALLNKYCDSFRSNHVPVYSFDSFFRGVSSEPKLRSILGAHHSNIVHRIWTSFCSNCL